MAAKHHQTFDHPAIHDEPDSTRSGPGLGRLAKRISSWTTKCLLTGIVLVAGLGFGRQVLSWWRAEPAAAAVVPDPSGPGGGLDDPAQLHVLRFGDQAWSVHRQSISGNEQAAAEALRAACRQALRDGAALDEAPTAAENELLRQLVGRDPIEQEPGKWRLYQFPEAFPMVAGIAESPEPAAAGLGKNLAKWGPRVVTWGLAIPLGLKAWALYTFQPEPRTGALCNAPSLPLPPGSSRTLCMGTVGGGAVVGFEGTTEPGLWKRFYDQWFTAQGWTATVPWQHSGAAWHARIALASASRSGAVDVTFTCGAGGHWSGVLIWTP